MIHFVKRKYNLPLWSSPLSSLLSRFVHGRSFTHYHRLAHVLQACTSAHSLSATSSLHALVITSGRNPGQLVFFYNNLIKLYASLDQLKRARRVFDEMPERSVVSYNAMIRGYSRCGSVEDAWEVFAEMRRRGFSPTHFTLGGLLSCELLGLSGGLQVLSLILKNGLLCSDAFAGTALLGLFGRLGRFHEVIRVFEDMPIKSLATWNSMVYLSGKYGFPEECGFFFTELARIGMGLSESSFVGVCLGFVREEHLESGEQVHCLVMKHGLDCNLTVANSLINMYVNCSGVRLAEKLFWGLSSRDVVSWNTIIGAFAKSETSGRAFDYFLKMPWDGISPNHTTFASVISSCIGSRIPIGQFIHAKVISNHLESNVFVGSALVDFYVKCDRMEDAHRCFDEIKEKNLVSWNTLILGYSNKSIPTTSVYLIREMLRFGYSPNEFSFSAALKSPPSIVVLEQLHSLLIREGYHENEYVLGSLIASYAKNDFLFEALKFARSFDAPLPVVPSNIIAGIYNRTGQYHETQNLYSILEDPDIVSWSILIAACARNGDHREAFELFSHMRIDHRCPDNYTFVSLLSICTKLCNLGLGSSIHSLIVRTNFTRCDTFVWNVLMDMYGKCGSIGSAVKIFNDMVHRDLITWTILISVLGLNGHALEALENFRKMEMVGLRPDGVAFTAALSACKHGGLVKEGIELFRQMKSYYEIEPQLDHYHCVVDLLARHGHLKEAEHLISSMPFCPDALIWRSFLQGCKLNRLVDKEAVG